MERGGGNATWGGGWWWCCAWNRCAVSSAAEDEAAGGGGGGCAITLVRDSLSEDATKDLRTALGEHGFVTYETAVGGGGVGVRRGDAQLPQRGSELAAWAAHGTWLFA